MRKIIINKIKCTHCGDEIESTHVHDFKWCRCRTVSVDGGKQYLKRSFKYSPNDYIDLSEYIDEYENKEVCQMREKKMNKTQKVLEHLQNKGTITSLEAIEHYGATRLSAIIYNLRKRGYNIQTVDVPFVDRFGTQSVYGKYILQNSNA